MSNNTSFGLSQIGQISVTVRDLERATAFYRDQLGMQLLFAVSNLSFFQCGGVRLMLSTPEKVEFDHPASILYYKVDDIQEAVRALSERGVSFTDEPHLIAKMPDHELWMAFLLDSEGNTLALMSEVPLTGN